MKLKVKVIVDSQELKTKNGTIFKTHVITSDNDVVPLLTKTPVKSGEIVEVIHIPKIFYKD